MSSNFWAINHQIFSARKDSDRKFRHHYGWWQQQSARPDVSGTGVVADHWDRTMRKQVSHNNFWPDAKVPADQRQIIERYAGFSRPERHADPQQTFLAQRQRQELKKTWSSANQKLRQKHFWVSRNLNFLLLFHAVTRSFLTSGCLFKHTSIVVLRFPCKSLRSFNSFRGLSCNNNCYILRKLARKLSNWYRKLLLT